MIYPKREPLIPTGLFIYDAAQGLKRFGELTQLYLEMKKQKRVMEKQDNFWNDERVKDFALFFFEALKNDSYDNIEQALGVYKKNPTAVYFTGSPESPHEVWGTENPDKLKETLDEINKSRGVTGTLKGDQMNYPYKDYGIKPDPFFEAIESLRKSNDQTAKARAWNEVLKVDGSNAITNVFLKAIFETTWEAARKHYQK